MPVEALFLPRSLAQAVELRSSYGDELLVMAGGTILMGLVNEGALLPRLVMSLRRAGLRGIAERNGGFEIGAATTAAELAEFAELPAVQEAAAGLGGPAVRTLATVGGNLFAKPPYGDLVVPLLALDTQVETVGPGGARRVPLEDLVSGSGTGATELVTALHVPPPAGDGVFLKLGRRGANVAAVVAVAVQPVDGVVRIALGAAGPHAFRARQAEVALADGVAAAAEAAKRECDPPTDALASAWYRREMVGVMVRRALERSGVAV